MTGWPARILIVGGEASGDLYGGLLMRAMTRINPGLQFEGIGGPSMQAAGLGLLGNAGAMGVTGFLEVISHLPVIWQSFREARRAIENRSQPVDLVILIDYPDFNLRLAKIARRAGIPVLYFISPQVWAWRPGRIRKIAARIDHMLVILPFEDSIYHDAGVPVTFVGHPLIDLVRPERNRRQALSLLGADPDRPVISLLPGSRSNELNTMLVPMLAAARLLREEFRDTQYLVSVAPTVNRDRIARAVATAGPWGDRPPSLVQTDRYDAIAASDAAVVASGTATVEVALLGVPMVIVYKVNPITYTLARRASNLAHFGMPNLIAGRRVVPELLQKDCAAAPIARELRGILTDPARAATMRSALAEIRARLGPPGAVDRAARVAWDMIDIRRGVAAASRIA